MAEMVPVEFWDWCISQVKARFPRMLFIAEVYNPSEYRNYLYAGHFDFLYDKVGLYDTLRGVICGHRPASDITSCWQSVDDIKDHMLNFLENHDEQRIASDFLPQTGERRCRHLWSAPVWVPTPSWSMPDKNLASREWMPKVLADATAAQPFSIIGAFLR